MSEETNTQQSTLNNQPQQTNQQSQQTQQQNPPAEQTETNIDDFVKEELDSLQTPLSEEDRLPPLVLEEGKIVEIEIDFSKPFQKWISPEGIEKRIVPVVHDGQRKVWWLNKRNPIYRQILSLYKNDGTTKHKVLQMGTKQNTRYTLVRE